jgi:hypothetical protein
MRKGEKILPDIREFINHIDTESCAERLLKMFSEWKTLEVSAEDVLCALYEKGALDVIILHALVGTVEILECLKKGEIK